MLRFLLTAVVCYVLALGALILWDPFHIAAPLEYLTGFYAVYAFPGALAVYLFYRFSEWRHAPADPQGSQAFGRRLGRLFSRR